MKDSKISFDDIEDNDVVGYASADDAKEALV